MWAEDQIERLQAVAGERGWTVANVFSDRPATAKKDRRPGEMAPLHVVRYGGVQKILILGIDRIGWSLTGYRWVEWPAAVRLGRDDGLPPPPNPSGQDTSGSSDRQEPVDSIRSSANRQDPKGRSRARIGVWPKVYEQWRDSRAYRLQQSAD
jgi:hypothetical protein